MKRALRLFELLRTQPDYVFGRFLAVRRLYSAAQRVRVGSSRSVLRVARVYMPETEPAAVAPSGLVVSDRAIDAHVDRLRDDAWSNGIALTAEAVAALSAVASTTQLMYHDGEEEEVFAPSLAALSADDRKGIALAQIAEGWRDATVQAIAGDATIVATVSKYLGYAPEKASVFFFWSFASALTLEERIQRNQTVQFHYDVDGYNFVYVSFYLVDVDRDGGAHVLIERTHEAKRLRHLFGTARLSDDEAKAAFGPEPIITIEAPAGQGFFEDTSCYHKALAPVLRDRLMLQIRYQ